MEDLTIRKIKNLKITRHFTIELSVIIEEVISEAIGELLNINWKESKSLGYKSEGLSFSQKVNLIQDINGISREFKNKLIMFMRIRNKFAHVKSINSFEYLFLENSCSDILKKLNDWYKSKHSDSSELKYRDLFFQLFSDIHKILNREIIESKIKRDVYNNYINYNKRLLDIFYDETHNSELGIEIYNKVLRKVSRHLKIVTED